MSTMSSFIGLAILYTITIVVALFAAELNVTHKVAIVIASLVAYLYFYLCCLYGPLIRTREGYLGPTLKHMLNDLIDNYKELFPGNYELRANVMRIRRKKLCGHWRKFLRVDFSVGDYTGPELEQEYLDNVGSCGTALNLKSLTIFDETRKQEPYKGITGTQEMATQHVKSGLSVPI